MENFGVIEQPPNIILKIQFFTQNLPNIKGKKLAGVHLSIQKKFFGPPYHIASTADPL